MPLLIRNNRILWVYKGGVRKQTDSPGITDKDLFFTHSDNSFLQMHFSGCNKKKCILLS